MEERDLEEIKRTPALLRAIAIMLRDHRRHCQNDGSGFGSVEIRITYENRRPVFVEDFGREKHNFK